MKIGYFGSPEISASLLRALTASSKVVFVVTNPDRAKGRSGSAVPTPVCLEAGRHSIPVHKFENLKDPQIVPTLSAYGADLFLVFAYGEMIPERIYSLPPQKTVNLHGSLLPKYRGASPVQSAVLHGDGKTGWTLQFINDRLDSGDIISSVEIDINPDETSGELLERMLPGGIDLTMSAIARQPIQAVRVQKDADATFCKKIYPEMTRIDWGKTSLEIHNLVRAMNPAPVARTIMLNKTYKIHKTHRFRPDFTGSEEAENQARGQPPGSIIISGKGSSSKLFVRTADSSIEIMEIQPENKKVMRGVDFINGYRLSSGSRFEY